MKLAPLALSALLICSCHRNQQVSCAGSPPEDDRNYAKWKAQQHADCDRPSKSNVR